MVISTPTVRICALELSSRDCRFFRVLTQFLPLVGFPTAAASQVVPMKDLIAMPSVHLLVGCADAFNPDCHVPT